MKYLVVVVVVVGRILNFSNVYGFHKNSRVENIFRRNHIYVQINVNIFDVFENNAHYLWGNCGWTVNLMRTVLFLWHFVAEILNNLLIKDILPSSLPIEIACIVIYSETYVIDFDLKLFQVL